MNNDIPNTMNICLTIDLEEEAIDIAVDHNFGDSLSEEEQVFYLDALNGIVSKIKFGIEDLAFTGMLMRHLAAMQDDKDEDLLGIDFEPSDELLQAIEDRKIIQFKKKFH
tara:strand:- start:6800 stop:7129 length:330 start_codon:yes stop_codon:yes gene_type:complete